MFSRAADRYERWFDTKIDALPLDGENVAKAREVISDNSSKSREEIDELLAARELPSLQEVGKASVASVFVALPASLLMGAITKLRGTKK